jgi:hypothetical protein
MARGCPVLTKRLSDDMQTAILAVSITGTILSLACVVLLVLVLRAVKPSRGGQPPILPPNAVPVTFTLPVTPAVAPPTPPVASVSGSNPAPPVPPTWVEEREKAYKGRQLEGVRVE